MVLIISKLMGEVSNVAIKMVAGGCDWFSVVRRCAVLPNTPSVVRAGTCSLAVTAESPRKGSLLSSPKEFTLQLEPVSLLLGYYAGFCRYMQTGRCLCGVRVRGCCQEMRKTLPIRSSLVQCILYPNIS